MKKKRMYVLILLFIVGSGFIYAVFAKPFDTHKSGVIGIVSDEFVIKEDSNIQAQTESTQSDAGIVQKVETKELEKIQVGYIHLVGAVVNPGIYECFEGMRLFQLLENAGGVSADADESAVNLARTVQDGERIYIPKIGENYVDEQFAQSTHENRLININLADKEQLMTLPGIGESRAEAIITHRTTKGKFNKIEDIMEIEGIKTAMFDKIKQLITVE